MSFNIAYTYEIIDKFSAPLRRIERAAKQVDKRLGKTTAQTRNLIKASAQFGDITKGQRNDIDRYGKALGKASQEAHGLSNNLKNMPKKFPKVPRGGLGSDPSKQLPIPRGGLGRGRGGIGGGGGGPVAPSGLSASLERAKNQAAGLRGQLMDTAATAALFALPIRQAIRFESSMASVTKVLGDIPTAKLAELEATIKSLAVSTGLGAGGIADIVAAGGRLGINVDDLPDFTKTVAKASVAFDMLPESAGDALASISNKMQIPINQIGNVADAINHLSDTTAAKAPNMIEILGRTAGTMALLKMPPEVAAGFASFADQVEVSAQLGASGLNMMISRMQKVPSLQKKLLENPKQAIIDVLSGLKKMDKASQFNVINKIFGDEAGRFVQKAVGNFDLLESTLGKVADKTKFAGSMTREFEVKMKTTQGGLDRMSSSLGVAAVNIGAGLLPAINQIADVLVIVTSGIASFAQEFPMLTTVIMGSLASLLALRLAFLAGSFIVTQFKIIMIGARLSMVAFRAAAVAMNVIPVIMGMIRAAALTMAITLKAATLGANLFKFALKGIMAASGIGLLVLAVAAIVEYWDEIVAAVKEAVSWMGSLFGDSEIDVNKTQQTEVTAVTEEAKAKAQNNRLDGQITVAASPGSEVVSTNSETAGPANLGFNMMSVM